MFVALMTVPSPGSRIGLSSSMMMRPVGWSITDHSDGNATMWLPGKLPIVRPIHSRTIVTRKVARAHEILDRVGLRHKADDYVTAISFGQQKLLSVARVLATEADLLLLDEPTAGLSAAALDNMVAVIRQLYDAGKTLLVVEHNTKVVKAIADHVVFLHQGRVLASGDPTAVLDRRDLAGIYFGGAL